MTPTRPSAPREIFGVLWTWVKGQFLIWLIATGLYLIGFAIARTPLWGAVAILCGIASAVPHFGAIFGLLLVLVFSFFGSGGDSTIMLASLAVWVIVQAATGFFVEPRLLGRKLNLNPWIVLLGGIA